MTDEKAMLVAIDEAKAALMHDDVPIGAVVLIGDKIIARRHNEREKTQDPTAHAEVLALRDASQVIGSWRLENATLVTTLEPCVMCAGALVLSRVSRLVFGTFDPKAGATGSLYEICSDSRLNHRVEVSSGVYAHQCSGLLKAFFAARR